jgi:hypothetical protein
MASRFREARLGCALSVRDAGKLFRVSPRTIRNWEAGRVLVPYAAFKLMRILRGYELPGASWRGWRLVGDTLWTPEGLAFHAWDASWWSLTVRMAHAFRDLASGRRRLPGLPAPAPVPASVAPEGAADRSPEGRQAGGTPGLVLSSTSENGNRDSSGKPGSEVTGLSPVVVLGVAA